MSCMSSGDRESSALSPNPHSSAVDSDDTKHVSLLAGSFTKSDHPLADSASALGAEIALGAMSDRRLNESRQTTYSSLPLQSESEDDDTMPPLEEVVTSAGGHGHAHGGGGSCSGHAHGNNSSGSSSSSNSLSGSPPIRRSPGDKCGGLRSRERAKEAKGGCECKGASSARLGECVLFDFYGV